MYANDCLDIVCYFVRTPLTTRQNVFCQKQLHFRNAYLKSYSQSKSKNRENFTKSKTETRENRYLIFDWSKKIKLALWFDNVQKGEELLKIMAI